MESINLKPEVIWKYTDGENVKLEITKYGYDMYVVINLEKIRYVLPNWAVNGLIRDLNKNVNKSYLKNAEELIKDISPFGTLPVSHPKVEVLINDLISEKEKYRQQRNLLNEKISNLLIAIEKGYVTIFPENDLTPDYIQDLEDAQKQIISQQVFNIGIENFLRNKLQETEEMQEYSVSTDTIRCWIDEYNNRA